jgi:hypothetical protein
MPRRQQQERGNRESSSRVRHLDFHGLLGSSGWGPWRQLVRSGYLSEPLNPSEPFAIVVTRLTSGTIGGVPPVDTRAQDGLMDLALHPHFAQNRTIYLTYSKPGDRGDTTTLASARFDGETLIDVRDLFVADAWSTHGGNSGSRIAFGLDGMIYMTVGERHERPPAQDLSTHKGKILRFKDDGTVPPDNPFVNRADARPRSLSTASAIRRDCSSTRPPARSGGTNMDLAAVTSSISSRAVTTTDGRRSRSASTTMGRRSPPLLHAPGWTSPFTTGRRRSRPRA